MPVVNVRTGRVISRAAARRAGIIAGSMRGQHALRYQAPLGHHPPPLEDHLRAKRTWAQARNYLDLFRPLPPGSITPLDLAAIDPDLFLGFNRILCRWEVWGKRAGDDRRPPYFVMRVVTHPTPKDDLGRPIGVCPYRPARARKMASCPASCPGKYEVPDSRLRAVLAAGRLRTDEDVERVATALEYAEDGFQQGLENYMTRQTEAIWKENFNRLLSISSTGYGTRKNKHR